MNFNLNTRIIRRKEEIYEFYYQSLGDKIRRTRLELNMTQEALAKGICSNTYISKIENNKIAINKEHLFLLMEKMGIHTDKVGFPEKMVESMMKAVEYFYFKDLDAYEILFSELQQYEFGILIYVVRLGYYVLTEDYENAGIIYDDMYRYLNSLEDYGFATFLIFGAYYNVAINDFQSARMILESVKDHLRNDEMLYSLFCYLEFLVYGHLHLFNKSRDGLEIARSTFYTFGNSRRLVESMVYANIFRVYEGQTLRIHFHPDHLMHLTESQINYYMIVLSMKEANPEVYLGKLKENGRYYLTGLYFLAKYKRNEGDNEEYLRIKGIIDDKHYSVKSRLDFGNLLEIEQSDKSLYYKEYLINQVMPYLEDNQNIYFHRIVTVELQKILSHAKRYKDGQKYGESHQEFIRLLQTDRKITL